MGVTDEQGNSPDVRLSLVLVHPHNARPPTPPLASHKKTIRGVLPLGTPRARAPPNPAPPRPMAAHTKTEHSAPP